MTILQRYLLTAFARFSTLSLGAFVGIYLLIDFFEKVDDFIAHQAAASLYLLFFLNKIPLIVTQVIPLAVLMGAFMTIGGFSRTSELTAMRAGGMSLMRITLPVLVISLGISLAVLAASEYLVPLSARKTNHILHSELNGKSQLDFKLDRLWFREKNSIVNIRLALPEEQRLEGISVFELDDNARPKTRTDALRAQYDGTGWTFEEVSVFHFDPATGELVQIEKVPKQRFNLAKAPQDFRGSVERNEELSIRDLLKLTRQVREEGYDSTRYHVDLHGRMATPFASFIMAFLGIPFALQRGRGASLAMGIGISVSIGISYHILQGMLLAFGYSGVFPPFISAWAPNLLFGLLGLWLLLSTRE